MDCCTVDILVEVQRCNICVQAQKIAQFICWTQSILSNWGSVCVVDVVDEGFQIVVGVDVNMLEEGHIFLSKLHLWL